MSKRTAKPNHFDEALAFAENYLANAKPEMKVKGNIPVNKDGVESTHCNYYVKLDITNLALDMHDARGVLDEDCSEDDFYEEQLAFETAIHSHMCMQGYSLDSAKYIAICERTGITGEIDDDDDEESAEATATAGKWIAGAMKRRAA